MTNKDFVKDQKFQESCKGANIPATKRQASKFRREFGKAFQLNRIADTMEKKG